MLYEEKIPKKIIKTGEPYIDIWLRFDTHVGHNEFDEEYYNEYLDWLSHASNRYDIWGGDNYELAIPNAKKYKYLSSQYMPPDVQWNDLVEELKFENKRHIIYVLGNHELGRIISTNFFQDELGKICEKYRINYSRRNTYLHLKLNKLDYIFYISHGRTTAFEPEYPIKFLLSKGIADADVLLVGHTHHNYASVFYRNYIEKRRDGYYLTVKKTLGIRPGSFLNNPEYAAQDRPRPVIRGNGILRLYADKRGMIYFENLDDWFMKNDVV